MSVILTLIIFGIIVVIHEWGHMCAAIACGVNVEEFAVGMGPKIFGWEKNGRLYSIRLFPLGGFCRMTDETEGSKKGFMDASVWKRIIICVAGPFMNFVLALAVMIVLGMMTSVSTTQVESVRENSAALEAGIQAGDRIISINGKRVHTASDVNYIMLGCKGSTMDIVLKRGGEKVNVSLTPKFLKDENRYIMGVVMLSKAPMIDVGFYDREEIKKVPRANLLESVQSGCYDGLFTLRVTAESIVMLFTRNIAVDELSGPIGVTSVVGDTYQTTKKESGTAASIIMLANITALLSANLGIMNLLPIPALDGGRLLVYVVEIIRRKKLPPEKEGMLNLAGFAILMLFAVFVAFNDITRIIK